MAGKSLAVAEFILGHRAESGDTVTPMQLLKLVYIAHGYMLGTHGRALLDEPVAAWQFGPVVPSVYKAVKSFGSSPVSVVPGAPPIVFSDDEKDVMLRVADTYGGHNGLVLSKATHLPGSPWDKTWKRFGKNAVISDDLIENHYLDLLNRERHSVL